MTANELMVKAKAAGFEIVKTGVVCKCSKKNAIVARKDTALWLACPCGHRENVSPFITIYRAIGGWQSVLMSFDYNDEYPFMSPWQTGMGPYGNNKEAAENDAKAWAKAEGIRFIGVSKM